jgi:uncharacterized protein (TIGR02996 family)
MSDVAENLVLRPLLGEQLWPFLAALQDDPEDELTLQAFADWLEERGDARADLIRANLAKDFHCAAGWVQRYGKRWWGEIPEGCSIQVELKGASSIHVKPGFLRLALPVSLLAQGEQALPATLWDVLAEGWVFRLDLDGALETTAVSALTRLLQAVPGLSWRGAMNPELAYLGPAPRLQRLTVQHANVSAGGLVLLAGLPLLRSLEFHECAPLTDGELLALSRLHRLRELTLSGTRLTNAGLAHLASLRDLRSLSLTDWTWEDGDNDEDGDITDEGIAHLARLTGLEQLVLGCPRMTVAGLNRLGSLTSLRSVDLWEFDQGEEGFTCLDGWLELESLRLRRARLREEDFARLGRCHRLYKLTLYDCRIEGEAGLIHLREAHELRTLSFSYSRGLSDRGVAALGGLLALRDLDLTGCPDITGPGLSGLSRLPQLMSLSLANCEGLRSIDLEGPESLLKIDAINCTALTRVKLAGLPKLFSLRLGSCTSLEALDLELPGLLFLYLSQCSRLIDQACRRRHPGGWRGFLGRALGPLTPLARSSPGEAGGRSFFSGVPGLWSLDLTHCDTLTDEGLAMLEGLTDLQSLSLQACWGLTDGGVRRLSGLTRLRTLDLVGCWRLTDASGEHLAQLRELKELNLPCDSGLSNEEVVSLSSRLPRCLIRARSWLNRDP